MPLRRSLRKASKSLGKGALACKPLRSYLCSPPRSGGADSWHAGAFAVAAALCSQNIEHFYCTDISITEHLNWQMLVGTDVKVHQMHLPHYLLPGEWRNTDEQREFILSYKAPLS